MNAEQAASAVSHLNIAAHRVEVEAAAAFALPPYAGSALRGGLGHALRAKVCLTGLSECGGCPLRARCLYPYAYETQLALPLGTSMRGDVPRPLILVPEPARSPLRAGERWSFGLTLIGSTIISALPYFIHALQRFGERGIGRQAARFRLIRVDRLPPGSSSATVWHEGRLTGAADADSAPPGAAIARSWVLPGVTRVAVRLLTPARFKTAGRFVAEPPPFAVLIARLLDRLDGISVIHHGAPLRVDFREWCRYAEAVRLVDSDVRWHDWTRYSSRQRTEMQLGGLLGSVTYEGDLSPFLPLLGVGEWVHVGKAATFGLGRYAVEVGGPKGGRS